MDSKVAVEIEGLASAQLVRPDVAQAKWLAFPFAALAWGMTQRAGDVQLKSTLRETGTDATVMFVDTVELFARNRFASDSNRLIAKSCDALTRFQNLGSSIASRRVGSAATTNALAGD